LVRRPAAGESVREGETLMLIPLDGPECPKCGYQQSELVSEGHRVTTVDGQRRTEAVELRRCGFCRSQFRHQVAAGPVEPAYAVAYVLLRCPHCRSQRTRVTSTRKPIRYHQCQDCMRPFKSVEQG